MENYNAIVELRFHFQVNIIIWIKSPIDFHRLSSWLSQWKIKLLPPFQSCMILPLSITDWVIDLLLHVSPVLEATCPHQPQPLVEVVGMFYTTKSKCSNICSSDIASCSILELCGVLDSKWCSQGQKLLLTKAVVVPRCFESHWPFRYDPVYCKCLCA